MSADELRELLPEPEYHEAIGVLEMIVNTPEDFGTYWARLKMMREKAAMEVTAEEIEAQSLEQGRIKGLMQGRLEGRLEGRQVGKLVGSIELLNQVLGNPAIPEEQLDAMDVESLRNLESTLRQQLGQRK